MKLPRSTAYVLDMRRDLIQLEALRQESSFIFFTAVFHWPAANYLYIDFIPTFYDEQFQKRPNNTLSFFNETAPIQLFGKEWCIF